MAKPITAVLQGLPTLADNTHVNVHVTYYEVNNGYNGTDTTPLLLSALAIPLTAALLNVAIASAVASAVNTAFGTSYAAVDVLLFSGCTLL